MADTIIDGTQFNSNNIKYSAPKVNASGGKSVNILNKATNTGLRISTPLMLTWGASDFEGNGKFEMALQFPSDEYKNPDTEAFLKSMSEFENKIKSDALTYSKEWFGKLHKSSEVVDALWTPMLKYSKDKNTGEYNMTKAPTLRIKIPVWEGVWRAEIYDEDGNKLFPSAENPCVTPLDFLQKGTNLAVLMHCGGLWFANGKFGMTWKLIQAVVQKPKGSLTGQCFIKLKPSDKEKLKNAEPPVSSSGDPDEVVSTLVEDSDGEDEQQVQKEPEPEVKEEVAVTEKPKKKVIKKKTDA